MKKGRKSRISILSLILLAIAVAALIIGLVAAKYVKEVRMPHKITVSADLAKNIEIFEHNATRTEHGDYETDTSEVTENEYILMPGVDVPKDPTVRIEGYTGLKAWLYVEIVESADFPATVTYTAADGWTPLPGLTGPNGGRIYYRELTNAQTGDLEFQVLKDNTVTVSEKIPRGTTLKLDFYAYITQESSTPEDDFTASFASTADTTNS